MNTKILVLQLARLGDIYQSWPVLRALKRKYPLAELHLMTRASFAPAMAGLDAVDRHWALDTRAILQPLIDERPALDRALGMLVSFCDEVRSQNFAQIINLSFSPFSSYLVDEIATENCRPRGYTRFSDGYLNIPDDGSAYFYAQVGVGKPNRIHVTDLFAHVADVELTEEDWRGPPGGRRVASTLGISENFIAIHVGASTQGKTLSWSKWLQVVRQLLLQWPGDVVLLGSKDEIELAKKISAVSGVKRPVNIVGKTNLPDLESIVRDARLLIGGDSAPVQIASLTDTVVLNISMSSVSFWETGPRSKWSRILPLASEQSLSAEEIVAEAMATIERKPTSLNSIRVLERFFPYLESRPQPMAFEWELLRALYMGETFPNAPSDLFLMAAKRLDEVNQLALEQIQAIKQNHANKSASNILDRASEMMEKIAEMVPEISPIVRWFKTETLRIGPMPVAELIESTAEIHGRLKSVVRLYCDESARIGDGHDDIEMGR